VPMIQAGRPVGAISVARRAARPFSAQQVALLQTFAEQAVIAIENVRLFTELEARNHALTVALDQQTATAEILRVISRSPADLQPVFDAIVDSAMRLFRAWSANVCQFDGELIHMVATRGGPPGTAGASIRGRFPTRPTAGLTVGRCILDRAVIRIDDVETDPDLVAATREMARTRGWRSALAVPMVREGEPVGALMVTRKAPGGFEAGSVELLQTFADQAVIAIENVRLFTELQARNRDLGEALERQTATAEILRVISGSPTDTAPVFQAIIERATRLSGADLGLLLRYEGGGVFRTAASAGAPAAFATDAQIPRRFERPFFREAGPWRATQIPDVRETEPYRRGDEFLRQSADTEGVRTLLIVPLVQEDRLIGSISIYRREVRPFTVAQVDLVRTFADQAVIAIENVRLFTELDEKNRAVTEALAQQTATSDILRVISRSPTDTQPVFDTIAASAMRLCDGHYGAVFLIEGEVLQFAAHHGFTPEGLAAFRRYYPMPVSAAPGLIARAIREMTVAHSADVRTDIDTTAAALERYRALGSHALIAAPMVRDGRVIGTVNVAREKIEPFSDAQIALLQTFADQAVIAIENVRLFTELEHRNRAVTDALDRQTATAEVLRAISGSPTDAQPVFETIAASAVRLTGGVAGGVYEYDGRLVHLRAMHPRSWPQAERFSSFFPRPLAPDYAAGRVILHRALLHVGDLLHDPDTPATTRTWAEDLGLRSVLWVPLLREGEAIGVVSVVRSEPGRFSDDQVALLETFADQAVIAIGNVRLFTQLQARNLDLTEALERQTATAEILRVISEARGDARPVFEAIAKSARRLLQGFSVGVVRVVGDRLDPVAIEAGRPGSAAAVREAIAQMPRRRGAHLWDAIIDRAVKQIHDAEGEALDVDQRARARARGWRASIAVPMLEDGEPIGVIAVGREAPGPFSPQQVELLKTFADQAVIAIKNAGLLTDLRARTDELTRSVDQLTALGEVGQAVSSSLELETVLTTIVSRAVSLTGADDGVVFEYDEASGEFTHRAGTETGRVLAEARRVARIRKGEGVLGRTAITHEPVQVADITQQGLYESRLRETLLESGVRALLAVPMLREGRLLGGLVLSRNRPGEFPPATVELLRTFATQSALAIQNARLYRALAEQGRQLEVASRHKSEFLASMSHELRTPLNAILGFNEMILGEIYGEIPSDLREPLTEMQNSGRHLLRLINNVLDLSKIEAGRMELALSDYAAQDAVEQVRASLHPLAVDRGLELVTAVPADLPLAHGDAGRIMQCLTNLVGNAIKFTRQGRVEIAAELRDGLLVYRVSDTGIGIEPDRIATLFTEFRQADPTIASEFGGSGLGLSITRKFAEMHGGRVWVESEPGTGSSFFLAVPLRAAGGPTA
jgi:GAF domain-containing protein/anti-sigma regulatory factor (Ser/Thr protein kinase)